MSADQASQDTVYRPTLHPSQGRGNSWRKVGGGKALRVLTGEILHRETVEGEQNMVNQMMDVGAHWIYLDVRDAHYVHADGTIVGAPDLRTARSLPTWFRAASPSALWACSSVTSGRPGTFYTHS